ncbi:MAG: type II secretion system GspH family protein [Synergistaceae bacterium]|nr:type II secretion system GspH family protein [Synergistaceae bacterium]
MKRYRDRGFTLIELLIVIMIIALLSGMMLLAAGSSVDGSEATKVINDLRDVKAAAMMYYMDESNWPAGFPIAEELIENIEQFMEGRSSGFLHANYDGVYVIDGLVENRSFIGLKLKGKNAMEGVKKKLAANATSCGIYQDAGATSYTDGAIVYMSLK